LHLWYTENKPQVNHLKGKDNRAESLEWNTSKKILICMRTDYPAKKRRKHNLSKLTEKF
jgi:hypothetical protein